MNLAGRFDRWAADGDFSLASLARLRILLATLLLLQLPNFHWVADYPSAWFTPPAGPFALFHAFPSAWFLIGIEVCLAASLLAMLVGWHTRVASVAVTSTFILGSGFTYSLGKIDHNILMALAPAVLSFSGWGRRLSIDARRGVATESAEQWPVRLLALLLGLAFMTAAIPKVLGGWLSPSTQTVQATLHEQFYGHERTQFLAETFINLRNTVFWESLDYLTIALEAGLLFAVVSWKGLRIACAVACIFHMSVYLMMNIAFTSNVMVYAAFMQWDRLLKPLAGIRVSNVALRIALPITAVATYLLFGSHSPLNAFQGAVSPAILIVGSAISVTYLAMQARDLLRTRRVSRADSVVSLPENSVFTTQNARETQLQSTRPPSRSLH